MIQDSVVTQDVPDYAFVGGIPARVIKILTPQQAQQANIVFQSILPDETGADSETIDETSNFPVDTQVEKINEKD